MKGVVNGFKIVELRKDQNGYDIQIEYLKDNKIFTNSQVYYNLNEIKIRKIEELLEDHTKYNRDEATKLCEVIPWITIIHELENIVYSK